MVLRPIGLLGCGQLDARQLRPAQRQRAQRRRDTGGDRAAEELALAAVDVEAGRRAEVDDDARPPVLLEGGERVHEPVGADLAGVVDGQRHPGARARPDDHRREVEVLVRHHAQHLGDDRHHRRDDHAVDVAAERQILERHQPAEHQRELVGRAVGIGRDAASGWPCVRR